MTGTGIYGWRVRALFPKQSGSQTQPGPWSATKPYTRTIAEPGGARTERIGVSVLLSWNAKPAAKNYRVQISQRADFQGTVEQVDTDNTSYAPTLLAAAYRSGGTFWWRVAARDEDTNIGDFSPAQQFMLAKQATAALTRLRLATKLVKARKSRRVTVTVRANGRAARGAVVRVFARGVTPLKAKTNRYGRVTFRIKKLGRGQEANAPHVALPRGEDRVPDRAPQHRHSVLVTESRHYPAGGHHPPPAGPLPGDDEDRALLRVVLSHSTARHTACRTRAAESRASAAGRSRPASPSHRSGRRRRERERDAEHLDVRRRRNAALANRIDRRRQQHREEDDGGARRGRSPLRMERGPKSV